MPNVFLAYSYRPERLSAWFGHYKQLHEPTESLDAAEREMIAVAVSMANGCLYCLVAHSAALRAALGAPILAYRITLDYRRAFRAILSAFHLSHPPGGPRVPFCGFNGL